MIQATEQSETDSTECCPKGEPADGAIDAAQGGPAPEPSGVELVDAPSLSSLPSVQFSPQAPVSLSPSDPTPASSYPTPSSYPSYLPAVAEDPEQSQGEAPEAANPKSSDIPLLTQEERRQILARLARYNPLDCFDESGAFDLNRARQVLPPGSIRQLTVLETTRTNADGQPVTERRINVSLFNPVAALRLDEQIERRNERAASSSKSKSDPYANFNLNTRKGFNLLREKTMALDDTLQEIKDLKKTLAGMDEEELRLNGELEELNRQLSETLSTVEGEAAPCSQALQSRAQQEAGFLTPLSENSEAPNPIEEPLQGDTGHQPAELKPQVAVTVEADTLNHVEKHPAGSAEEAQDSGKVAAKPPKKREPIEIRLRKLEIEHRRNTSGTLGFAIWLRAKQAEWAEIDSQALYAKLHPARAQKTPSYQPARPPP